MHFSGIDYSFILNINLLLTNSNESQTILSIAFVTPFNWRQYVNTANKEQLEHNTNKTSIIQIK